MLPLVHDGQRGVARQAAVQLLQRCLELLVPVHQYRKAEVGFPLEGCLAACAQLAHKLRYADHTTVRWTEHYVVGPTALLDRIFVSQEVMHRVAPYH